MRKDPIPRGPRSGRSRGSARTSGTACRRTRRTQGPTRQSPQPSGSTARHCEEPRITLLACEALFLRRRHDLAVPQERRRAVVVEGRDAKYVLIHFLNRPESQCGPGRDYDKVLGATTRIARVSDVRNFLFYIDPDIPGSHLPVFRFRHEGRWPVAVPSPRATWTTRTARARAGPRLYRRRPVSRPAGCRQWARRTH